MLASKNNDRGANFAHLFLLHEGKNIERNIEEAIHYYKEVSSFNNQYTKNNLGIIYKHGYDEIKGQSGRAIIYFEEAIRQKNDYLSMYNLAHIYIYDKLIKGDINKAIELLVRSSKEFFHSTVLLSIALIKRFNFSIETIKQQISQRKDISRDLSNKIFQNIQTFALYDKFSYEILFKLYRNKDFVYNILLQPVLTSDLDQAKRNDKPPKYPNAKDISSEFYKGFGINLL